MDCGEANLFGKPEVENFGVAALGDKNVGRFNVAVDDSFAVGRVERVGDVNAQVQKQFQIQGAARDAVLQRFPVKTFHGDVGLPIFFANFVNGADVGMIQRGGGSRFAAETFERLLVFRHVLWKEFQGNVAA